MNKNEIGHVEYMFFDAIYPEQNEHLNNLVKEGWKIKEYKYETVIYECHDNSGYKEDWHSYRVDDGVQVIWHFWLSRWIPDE